jgi:hypothetical protein
MKIKVFLILLFLIGIISYIVSCQTKNYEYKIVVGSSFATGDEAAKEAELKVNNLTNEGWEAISIGGGGRAMGISATREIEISGGSQVVDVFVLMRHAK